MDLGPQPSQVGRWPRMVCWCRTRVESQPQPNPLKHCAVERIFRTTPSEKSSGCQARAMPSRWPQSSNMIEQLGLSLHTSLKPDPSNCPSNPPIPARSACDRWLALHRGPGCRTRAAFASVDCGTCRDRGRDRRPAVAIWRGWIMTGLASLRSALARAARHLPTSQPRTRPAPPPTGRLATPIHHGHKRGRDPCVQTGWCRIEHAI